jgi:hypothetical protein
MIVERTSSLTAARWTDNGVYACNDRTRSVALSVFSSIECASSPDASRASKGDPEDASEGASRNAPQDAWASCSIEYAGMVMPKIQWSVQGGVTESRSHRKWAAPLGLRAQKLASKSAATRAKKATVWRLTSTIEFRVNDVRNFLHHSSYYEVVEACHDQADHVKN